MKKFIKIVKIILLSLLVFVLVGYVVLYVVKPDEAKQILDKIVEYANKPLPIVGVSSLVFATLIWKIFSYSFYGKKTVDKVKTEYESEKRQLKADHEANKTEYVAVLGCYRKELDVYYDSLKEICEATPNKKVKQIGENLSNRVSKLREDLKIEFDKISNSDAEILIQSKEEIIESIIESVKKELIEKYGKESQEIVNSISKA